MDAPHAKIDRTQNRQLGRFERMGLSARPMPDGRSLVVSLPFGPQPLESVAAAMLPRRVVFSTVGAHHIKCLTPRAFFGLPLIDIRRCADAASIEASIRQAWRERTNELTDSRAKLRDLGLDVEPIAENSALAFPLRGESSDVPIITQRLGEAILPSAGPLTGLPLDEPEDRVLEVSDCLDSGSDLERRVDQRIHELGNRLRQAQEDDRNRRHRDAPSDLRPPPKKDSSAASHHAKILVVGPQLVADTALREELERQGFRVDSSLSEPEALSRLASMSPDLVISQYGLGRSDGASLVQAMCGLPGIERIPVVLFDEVRNEGRLQVARTVGAAGYITEPIEAERVVTRLGRLVQEPADRRFTRYRQRLAARLEGASQPFLVTELGRGGIFIATPQILESNTAIGCKIELPNTGRTVVFEGEVRYCAESRGVSHQGIGLRFFEMPSDDEAALIEYLATLESRR
jgi:two-component system chemotaxis response regulator CheY